MTGSTFAARIERIDPRLDSLIPLDAAIEVLFDADSVAGPHWLEGPAWTGRTRRCCSPIPGATSSIAGTSKRG